MTDGARRAIEGLQQAAEASPRDVALRRILAERLEQAGDVESAIDPSVDQEAPPSRVDEQAAVRRRDAVGPHAVTFESGLHLGSRRIDDVLTCLVLDRADIEGKRLHGRAASVADLSIATRRLDQRCGAGVSFT
jgi:hypothetical protein